MIMLNAVYTFIVRDFGGPEVEMPGCLVLARIGATVTVQQQSGHTMIVDLASPRFVRAVGSA